MSKQVTRHLNRFDNQRGMATVLITLLVGLALVATVLETASYLRGSQEQAISSHGLAQAQMKAWTGVEVLREYLTQIQATDNLAALAAAVSNSTSNQPATPFSVTLSGINGISAQFTAVDSVSAPTQFTATLIGTSGSVSTLSTSIIQAVYKISNGNSTPATPIIVPIAYNGNLKISGDIKVNTSAKNTLPVLITVIGDISSGGNSITGVNVLNSTGSVNLGGNESFTSINANCDVNLAGSITTVNISAMRNVCLAGGTSVTGTALANGSIQAAGSSNGILNALGNNAVVSGCAAPGSGASGTSAAVCPIPTVNGIDLSGASSFAQAVNTKGSVVVYNRIGNLNATVNLSLVGYSAAVNSASKRGVIGGKIITNGNKTTNVFVDSVAGHNVSIVPASPVIPPSTTFDAYQVQSDANFIFTYDANGYPKVTVQNVNNIPNATYYLGNYADGHKNYLCTSIAGGSSPASPQCSVPASAQTGWGLCGSALYNDCFLFDSVGGNWTIYNYTSSVSAIAPGIDWFQGNLKIASGQFFNTFIATGNITNGGNPIVYAVNYAGYNGSDSGVTYAPTGICANSVFHPNPNSTSTYPSQLCNIDNSTYIPTSDEVGNYALLAGSYIPGTTTYVGGDIQVGSTVVLNGNIKAGNKFSSSGSTSISGMAQSLGQGNASSSNVLGGSTVFNLANFPSTFALGNNTTSTSNSPSGTKAASGSVSVLWAKYL